MAIEIKIPSMGESISSATIGSILKPAGSRVVQDDEILELETDKLNQVLYAPATGILSLTIKSGDVVAIGQVIGAVAQEAHTPVKKEEPVVQMASQTPIQISKASWIEELEQKPVSEVVETVVTQSTSTQARSETRKPLSSIRKAIASRLVQAQAESASLTTFNEVDMSEVIKLREQYKDVFMKTHGVKLGFMSFFVKASTSALRAFPLVNAYLDKDVVVYRNYIDISVAVSTEKGLFVPVLRDCEALSFADIEKNIADLSERAKKGTIVLDEIKGGGFTITNGGVFGSLLSTPILNPPQCAILGMHAITKRAVVVNDAIVIRPMMYLALTYDHRLLDGREAVQFLVHLKNCIEDPHRLELGV